MPKLHLKNICALALAASLVACAKPVTVWDRPGTTTQSFSADRLECTQTANATVPGYLAAGTLLMVAVAADAHNNAVSQAFSDCMQAKGYVSHIEDAASLARKSQLAAQLKEIGAQEKVCFQANRDKSIYASLLPHLPNLDTGSTPAQLAETSIPSPSESQLLSELYDESAPCRDRYITDSSKVVPALELILLQRRSDTDTVMSLLIKQQLTWGEAARRFKQAAEAVKANANALLNE
jgi:hypothetical protein